MLVGFRFMVKRWSKKRYCNLGFGLEKYSEEKPDFIAGREKKIKHY